MKATQVLITHLPLLTSGVSIRCERELKKKLSSTVIAAGFVNKNVSKLSKKHNKIWTKYVASMYQQCIPLFGPLYQIQLKRQE